MRALSTSIFAALFIAVVMIDAARPLSRATQAVSEAQIVSLANAPEVVELEGATDVAGRSSVRARVRFANECYLQAGIRALAGQVIGGEQLLIILQEFPPSGCPEIYQPVEQDMRVLLPGAMAGGNVNVVAKPAPRDVVWKVDLSRQESLQGGPLPTIESRPIGTDTMLPRFSLGDILPGRDGIGYSIAGQLSLSQQCSGEQFGLRVFEVPDADGEPSFDVLVVTGPPQCISVDRSAAVEFEVGTPQPSAQRAVYVANEVDPEPRSLGRLTR